MVFAFRNNVEKVLVLTALALLFVSIFQWFNNRDLRKVVSENKKENKILVKANIELEVRIKNAEAEKNKILRKTDSVLQRENYFRNKYYFTDEKLKGVLGAYGSSDRATKNKLFTDAVNN